MRRRPVQGKALPKGWRRVKLKEIASVKTGPFGAQLHQHDYVKSDGTPIVTVEHLSENGLVHENLPLVADHDKKRLFQFLVQEGDILFSRVGSVDRSSLVSKKEERWLFSGRLLRVRPDNKIIDSRYLKYFFSTEKFKHHMRSLAVGGIMPSLNTAILSNVKVSYPVLSLQRKIAELLSEWDMVVEKTERLIAAKEKQFKWLVKRIISDQQDNPKWRKVKLKDVGLLSSAGVDKKTVEGENPVRLVNFLDVRFQLNENWDTVFRAYAFKSSYFYKQAYRMCQGGGQRYVISQDDFRSMTICIPNLEEQRKIAQTLRTAQKEIDLLKQITKQYRTQKREVIKKLLMGEWKVKS